MTPTAPDALTAFIQRIYAPAVTPPQDQLAAAKRLQGGAFDARLDANHPLQTWAKRISDTLLGQEEPTEAGTKSKERWATWTPIALLAAAVFLVFTIE